MMTVIDPNQKKPFLKSIYNKITGLLGSKLFHYILRKLLNAFVSFFVALTLVFYLYHVLPGNPTNIFATDPRVSPEVRENIIIKWGLDKPIHEQYFLFLKNLFLHGDLGYSFLHRKPVTDVIWDTLPWTLLLLGVALIIQTTIGILLGAYVAWRRGSKMDTTFVLSYNVYNAFPLFFIGLFFAMIFGSQAKQKGWPIYFPIFGAQDPTISSTGSTLEKIVDIALHMFLPLVTLVLFGILGWGWFMRGNLLQVLTEDYILTAKAKGLDDNQILYRHGMRNAILPVVTSIGLDIGVLIGGNVLIEAVFSYPGTGFLLYEALLRHDYPVVQGAFIIISGLTLAGLFISEVLYGIIDPRIRTE
ncbi:MAG: Dipeptide transport system permease protein DppB [Candidatus Heimdallarchaeota archaeon LC_2]|nr:MAG: Dipeptide transport system permease protein DppB [Candidatus Heimdallarchaeota archaeon LC_2]